MLDRFMTRTDLLATVLGLLAAWKSWHPGTVWYANLGHAALAALIVYGFVHLIGAALEDSGPASKRPGRPKGRPGRGGRR